MDQSQLDADLTAAAGIAVDVAPDPGTTVTSRQTDSTPFYGGAAVLFAPLGSTGHCSDAFSVYGTSSGTSFMLTAAHCSYKSGTGYLQGTWYNNGVAGSTQKVIGTTYTYDAAWDTMSIKLASGTSNSATIYDGTNTTSATHTISGHYSNWIGDYVCTDGANSGAHCNLRVSNDNYSWTFLGTTMKTLILADSPSSAAATVGGDSGGPVITASDYSLPNRIARGVMSGGTNPTTCPAVIVPVTNCYRSVIYGSIRPVLSSLNVTLRTA